jgi:hypothetical protein
VSNGFTITSDGPYQGWRVQPDSHSWQFRTTSRTLALHNPRGQAEVLNARFTLALTIDPHDPQWELFTAAENSRAVQVRAVIPALVLPRIHATIADPAAGWSTSGRITEGLSGWALSGDRASVRITAWVPKPDHCTDYDQADAQRLLATAVTGSRQVQAEAFGWVKEHVPRLPGMPAPSIDWAERTEAFLRGFEQQRVGLIKVLFANAISTVGREIHTVGSVEDARTLAGDHWPFNNTRITAWRITGWKNGHDVTETVDLSAPAGSPKPSAPPAAAGAFPKGNAVTAPAATADAVPPTPPRCAGHHR